MYSPVQLLGVILFTFMVFPASAAKLYKIVDESGKVTFSQFPPEEAQNTVVEDVEVKSKMGKSKVERRGGKQYCGSILLNTYDTTRSSYSDSKRMSKLEQAKERWEDKLMRLEESVDRMSRSQFKQSQRKSKWETDSDRNKRYGNYQSRHESSVEQLKDYRCAIEWAESRLNSEAGKQQIASINEEADRLRGVLRAIEKRRDSACGEEPLYDPSQPHMKHRYSQWKKCNKMYARDISDVKRKLRNL